MEESNKKLWIWGVVSFILLIPAIFLNLGMNSFIEDEGTRGIVAMEMIYQNDFITPTISGEYYYNKPPFYNWIIAGSFMLFGNFSPFALRFPMAISIFLYGITVFLLTKRRLGNYFAFILALATVTSGRILIYDSLHGLIDITMGWFTFVLFVSIYELYERRKFYLLFIIAYFISACTYLMKGLPSIAFLGISLLTLFIYKKDFKRLFSLQHLAGILVFLGMVGGYYYVYTVRNDNSLLTLFKILFVEANKKSVGGNDLVDTITHLFTFPFQYLIDFLPYTLFVIFFVRKRNIRLVWQNNYTRYLIVIFFFNILIFWISPVVFARYLLMFIPLAYAVMLYPYMKQPEGNQPLRKIVHVILIFALAMFVLSPIMLALVPQARVVDGKFLKAGLVSAGLAIVLFSYIKSRKHLLFHFILGFILVRIAFNLFIVPIRTYDSWHFITQKSATRVGKEYKNKDLCIYDEPSIFHEPDKLVQDKAVYFLSKERGEIVPLCTSFEPDKLYIVDQSDYDPDRHTIIDHLYSEPGVPLYVIEMKN